MDQHAGIDGFHGLHDPRDGLDRADLVVREHDRDEGRLAGPDGRGDGRRVHDAAFVDADLCDFTPSLLLQRVDAREDRRVLDARHDDVRPVVAQTRGDGPVVGLAAAAAEGDFFAVCVNERRHGVPRLRHRVAARRAVGVARRRVAPVAVEVGQHRVADFRINGARRRVVEVDAVVLLRQGFWASPSQAQRLGDECCKRDG